MLKADAAPKARLEAEAAAPVASLAEIGLERFAPYLLNRIAARWNADMQARVKAHGLNVVRMRTLAVLSVMPGATVSELALHAVTEQSTMSRALDGMVRDGLVRRQSRPGDMRVRELRLTPAGDEAFRRFWPEMHAALQGMFAGFSTEEYETLIRLMTRALGNIEQTRFDGPVLKDQACERR